MSKGPVEIERKFLVRALPRDYNRHPHGFVSQGYLVIGADGSEARVRRTPEALTLTVKSSGDLVRGEWETEITEPQFNTLWPGTEGRRVEKTRYYLGGQIMAATVELDIYEGALSGLVTAEVEFLDRDIAEEFVPLPWFGEEVTAMKGLKNQMLAVHGIPEGVPILPDLR